jgi:hypothetical protein
MKRLPFLEDELNGLIGEGSAARIVARLHGFDGYGGASLRSVAAEVGLSHEAVRQIAYRATLPAREERGETPTLNRVISVVCKSVPGNAVEIEELLQQLKLTRRPFRLEGLVSAANALRRELPFSVCGKSTKRLVHGFSPTSLKRVITIARKKTTRSGLTSVSAVLADLDDSSLRAADIVFILSGYCSHIKWLDRSRNWLWLPECGRNPILTSIRKVLAATGSLNSSELYDAIRRSYRRRELAVPLHVFEELCAGIPGVEVKDGVVKNSVLMTRLIFPRSSEGLVARVLAEQGPLRRAALIRACQSRGVCPSTVSLCALCSPLIKRLNGQLALIGSAGSRTVKRENSSRGYTARSVALHAQSASIS